MINVFVTGEEGTIPKAMRVIPSNCRIVNAIEPKYDEFKTHQSFQIRPPEVDFLNRELLFDLFSRHGDGIDVVVHSGAYVGTDFCDSDSVKAIETNNIGTQNIIEVCNEYKKPLILISTTAIFDPKAYYGLDSPITEDTVINPQTLYGVTKYFAELQVQRQMKGEYFILRPVFGFGDYPDDLHSALTKVIYTLYKNYVGLEQTTLELKLAEETQKSYIRVENIANVILKFAEYILRPEMVSQTFYNVGKNYRYARNWEEMFPVILNCFERHEDPTCPGHLIDVDTLELIYEKSIIFNPEEDYLGWHNIDDRSISRFKIEQLISFEEGVQKTVSSVIQNINMEPYWI